MPSPPPSISHPAGHWDEERKKEPVVFNKDAINLQAAENVLRTVVPVLIEEGAPFDIYSPGAFRDGYTNQLHGPSDHIIINVDTTYNFNVIKRMNQIGIHYEKSFNSIRILAVRIMREGNAYEPTEIGRNLKLQAIKKWSYQTKLLLKFLGPSIKFLVKSEISQIHVAPKDYDRRTRYGTYSPDADTKNLLVQMVGTYPKLRYMQKVAESNQLVVTMEPTQYKHLMVIVPWESKEAEELRKKEEEKRLCALCKKEQYSDQELKVCESCLKILGIGQRAGAG